MNQNWYFSDEWFHGYAPFTKLNKATFYLIKIIYIRLFHFQCVCHLFIYAFVHGWEKLFKFCFCYQSTYFYAIGANIYIEYHRKIWKSQIILYLSNKEKVIPFQWYTKCCKLILSKLFSVIQKKTLLKFDLKCIMTLY